MHLPRTRVVIPIALALLLMVGCAAPGNQAPQTSAPPRTLVPTFTPKPAATPLPPTPTAVPATATPAEPPTATPPPATPTPPPKPMAIVTLNNLNIRSGPSTSYASIARGAVGQRLEITGRNTDSSWWQACCVNSKNGWVAAQYVRVEGNVGGVEVVKDVAPPPTQPPLPTARPRPTTPPAQPTTPPAAATIFGQAGTEIRNADDANFGIVTFWGRLGKTGDALPISGGYKLRVSAPTGTLDVAFGERWQNAYPGQPSEFRYNAKLELPRTAGAFRAVVVDGSGKEVSDAITGELRDKTHDVLLTWFRR